MTKINHFYSSFLLMAAVSTTTAADLQNIKIAAGREQGEYTKTIVPALSEALKSYGYSATPVISEGSQDNINQVLAGTVPAGLSQFDAAAFNMTAAKDPDGNLMLIGKMAPEALFCAAKKNGRIKTYADIIQAGRQTPLKISVGAEKSGTKQTIDYLITLKPQLKESVELSNEPDLATEIRLLIAGQLDLVCFMMMPNPENELIQRVVNHKELFFLDIDEPAFTSAKVGPLSVYETMNVPVSQGVLGLGSKKVKTLVTWAGLVINKAKVEPKLQEALTQVVQQPNLLPATSLTVTTQRLLEDFTKMIMREK